MCTSRRVPPTLPCPMTCVLLWWEGVTSMVSILLLGLEPYAPQGQSVTVGRKKEDFFGLYNYSNQLN